MLIDRDVEKRELGTLLVSLREGLSAARVLRGEAGIGKTALLEYVVASAPDMHVSRVAGTESEIDLGFAALHQLLAPFLPRLERLPAPQRAALGSAFGLIEGPAPSLFLVGLATLTLLADEAAQRPLLCVIDDAQWLDQGSAHVLGFVARRLFADRIGMLFALRDPIDGDAAFAGLSELRVGGLIDDDARKLLDAVTAGRLDHQTAARIIAASQGNPLALMELGEELLAGGVSRGAAQLAGPLPLGPRLEARFLSRVKTLPQDTQTLLLLAAAEQYGDSTALWRAAEHLGVGPEAADLPELDHLIAFEPAVSFRHTLVRSAVYHGASGPARRRAHEALALALDPERDPDRRAWHLAAATVAPDEHVAAQLERAADRARRRGGWASGAAFLARAAELT
ncbi:MAG TPA: AAA family ATPase, partial [Acidimicrobiales bacterium]|nr:AAA family ATPase [Acidimicrobiales bacterium]